MSDPRDLLEANPPEEEEGQEETPSQTGLGSIPGFRTSPSRSRQSRPSPTSEPAPQGSSDPDGATSSPGSTEPDPPKPGDDDWVDPKDLQAAIRQTVDVGFVLVGQGFGVLEKRAKGLPAVDPKWVPTEEERQLVQAPAARLAKRHVKAPAAAMDTIDICLIAAGVGSFAVRGVTGAAPMGGEPANA